MRGYIIDIEYLPLYSGEMKAILKRAYLDHSMRQPLDVVFVFDYLPNSTVVALAKRYHRHGFLFHKDPVDGSWNYETGQPNRVTYVSDFGTETLRSDHEKACVARGAGTRWWVGVSFNQAQVSFPLPPAARETRQPAEPKIGVLVHMTVGQLAGLDGKRLTITGRQEGRGSALLRLAGLQFSSPASAPQEPA